MKLRSVRERGPGWEPRFFERDPRFWPIARAASVFADSPEWPTPEAYARAFEGEGPVRFETQAPRVRVRHGRKLPLDREALYDARIVKGVVPTRPKHWHDYLNALVWATFPNAKRALHARQHALIEAWIPEGARQLPNARTKAQDALAIVDEGGVLLLSAGTSSLAVPFGHALFEGLVFSTRSMVARALPLEVDTIPSDRALALRLADSALANMLGTREIPAPLVRYAFAQATPEPRDIER